MRVISKREVKSLPLACTRAFILRLSKLSFLQRPLRHVIIVSLSLEIPARLYSRYAERPLDRSPLCVLIQVSTGGRHSKKTQSLLSCNRKALHLADNVPAIHLQFTEYYFPDNPGLPGTEEEPTRLPLQEYKKMNSQKQDG